MDQEQLNKGRAVIDGRLGGARAACAITALAVAVREAFDLRGDAAEAWPDTVAVALADIDSALEVSAARAAVIRDKDSALSHARAEARRSTEEAHKANAARVALEDELAEAREALATWHAKAQQAERRLSRLTTELGGLTLSTLPRGGYGAALASEYVMARDGDAAQ